MEARSEAFLSGIFYDSLRLRVFEAQPSVYNVYVHHLPFEVPDEALEEVLSAFGVIHSITEQTFPDSAIYNGTRVVKMTVTTAVPSILRVLRFPCRVYYKDQPMSCYICKKSHRASNCPLRDVCRRCRQPGHFAKDCTVSDPAPAPAADPPAPAAPSDSAPATAAPAPAAPPDQNVSSPDADPDYVPPADEELSSAPSSDEMSGDPASGDEEVAAQSTSASHPRSSSLPSSVPSSPASPAPAVPRRRKFKPNLEFSTKRRRKSAAPSPDAVFPPAPPDDPVPIFPDYPFSDSDFPPCLPSPEEGPESPSAEDLQDPEMESYSPFVHAFTQSFVPVDGSDSFCFGYFVDFGSATLPVLFGNLSFEEVHLESLSDAPVAFSVMPDCPPIVDLPPLSADVVPLQFPKKKES